MYEIDGIVYADDYQEQPRIIALKYTGSFQLLLAYSDGQVRLLDGPDLFSNPIYEPLRDERNFKDFSCSGGYLSWCDGRIDVAPEWLLEHTYEYPPTDRFWER